MTGEVISSRNNPLVKHARAVRDGKETGLMFVEGIRLCEEAAHAGVVVEDVLFTDKLTREPRGSRLLETLTRGNRRTARVSEDVLESVSDTKTPQGIVVLARCPRSGSQRLLEDDATAPLIVIMHKVNNPANAGAMLRVAEAAGATGAVTTVGSTDIFSSKSLRGAMGSTFRLPVWTGARLEEVAAWCAERKIRIVSTDLRASHAHTGIDWTVPRAIIVGAEGSGLDESESRLADESIRIPMRGPVESLNVAVALAIVLYEAARQRGLSA